VESKTGLGISEELTRVRAIAILQTIAAIFYMHSVRGSGLWITSPSKKTTVKLPFYTALRVVRKRGWSLTEVEPTRHSRWELFKLAIKIGKGIG